MRSVATTEPVRSVATLPLSQWGASSYSTVCLIPKLLCVWSTVSYTSVNSETKQLVQRLHVCLRVPQHASVYFGQMCMWMEWISSVRRSFLLAHMPSSHGIFDGCHTFLILSMALHGSKILFIDFFQWLLTFYRWIKILVSGLSQRIVRYAV